MQQIIYMDLEDYNIKRFRCNAKSVSDAISMLIRERRQKNNEGYKIIKITTIRRREHE